MEYFLCHPNPEISLFYSKGFSEISNPINGRALHCFCLRHFSNLSIFHSNTLLNFYFKLGRPSSALKLFDQMPLRNHASWNTVISGCAASGRSSTAAELFALMREAGEKPSGFVLASLASSCCRVEDGVRIHCFVLKLGLLSNVYVGTALLHLYGKNALSSDARKLFDDMPERNVVTWTALMTSCNANSEPVEAARVYQSMRKAGVVCNENSYAAAISSCGLLESDRLCRQVLAHVVISGLEAEVSVSNSLITAFGNTGRAEEAERLFRRMGERDTISWNSMLSIYSREGMCEEALCSFSEMRRCNFEPDITSLSCMISSVCAGGAECAKWGMGFHGFAVRSGLDSCVSVINALMSMYSMLRKFEDAEMLFCGMTAKKDVITWNTMMCSYSQSGSNSAALKLFSTMLELNIECNHVTFAAVLAACTSQEALLDGRMIHALAILDGFEDSLLVGNSLITMYASCGSMRDAERVLGTMPRCDIITWNALIGGYADNEERNEMIAALNQMRRAGIGANYITVVNALGACFAPQELESYGKPLHAHTVSAGLESNEFVLNSLITVYANGGDFGSSRFIFDGMRFRSAVSWNAMIASGAHCGRGEEAMKCFKEMLITSGMKDLDQFSFSGGLSASACLASRGEGTQLHCLIIKLGFDSDLHVINAAMDMYGKCGEMGDVLKLLPEASERSRLSWNIAISCYARNGRFGEAEDAFYEMLRIGPKPDRVTFVSILTACNHAGLVDKGLAYYKLMSAELGISPRSEHCACIVDLLGRSGRLTEAEEFVKAMPVLPNSLVWRSLLSASRIHRRLDVGLNAAEHLLRMDPSDESAYVLLANACALSGRWEDAERLRARMEGMEMKRRPARSWIQARIGEGDHLFQAGMDAAIGNGSGLCC